MTIGSDLSELVDGAITAIEAGDLAAYLDGIQETWGAELRIELEQLTSIAITRTQDLGSGDGGDVVMDTCPECGGDGVCPQCSGDPEPPGDCECSGSGECGTCDGQGEVAE